MSVDEVTGLREVRPLLHRSSGTSKSGRHLVNSNIDYHGVSLWSLRWTIVLCFRVLFMHMYHFSMLPGVKITLLYKPTVKINCQKCIFGLFDPVINLFIQFKPAALIVFWVSFPCTDSQYAATMTTLVPINNASNLKLTVKRAVFPNVVVKSLAS